ncbi:MAG: hypothetical protein JG777_1765 [Clostridia bacterium]|nr:hypothetical protein [Clostridia bacterium]
MFDIVLDIFRSMKNWKKALLFSFVSYMVVLFGITVLTVFIRRGFSKSLPIIAGVGTAYMFLLLAAIIVAWILFRKRLITE